MNPRSGSNVYPYYVLFVLALVNMFNYVDRHVVSVLLVPIKQEFQVSDEWMGLLTGMAFMLVHAMFGIPLARWADNHNRRNVMMVGVAVYVSVIVGVAVQVSVIVGVAV